jgi:DNA-binding LytR/AlgR family response regulator
MNVLIIEDESRAAKRLQQLLADISMPINVVSVVESVEEGINFFTSGEQVQLIFSDIQLGDGLSFEIFEKVSVICPIIFTTAFDQYAIEAFKTNGIDYLLKPIEDKDLRKAIEKVNQLSPAVSIENILSLANSALQNKSYKSRFVVKVGDKIKSIHIEDILVIYSHDKATFAFTRDKRNNVLDYSLDHIETLIDPNLFFRGSRKFMIALEACEDITAWSSSRLKINVEGLSEPRDLLVVARDRVTEFKQWLDR